MPSWAGGRPRARPPAIATWDGRRPDIGPIVVAARKVSDQDRRGGTALGCGMDFALSAKADRLRRAPRLHGRVHLPQRGAVPPPDRRVGNPHFHAPILDELKVEARKRGLWNLFLPHATEWTEGLSNLDYAPLAEITGRSHLAPEASTARRLTRNMEILTMFGTDEQKERGCGRCSRARSVVLRHDRAGRGQLRRHQHLAAHRATATTTSSTGRKWWISGAAGERCRISIVMGKTDSAAPPHRQQSMILVPLDTRGSPTCAASAGVRLPGQRRPL